MWFLAPLVETRVFFPAIHQDQGSVVRVCLIHWHIKDLGCPLYCFSSSFLFCLTPLCLLNDLSVSPPPLALRGGGVTSMSPTRMLRPWVSSSVLLHVHSYSCTRAGHRLYTQRPDTLTLCVCARALILSTSSVSIKSKALPIYSHCLPAGNKPLSSKRSSLWICSCFFTLFLPCWELSPLTSVHVQLPAGNWFFFSAPLSEVVKCGSSLWSVKISRWRQIRVCAELAGLCCTAARLLGIYTLYITTKCDEAEVALHTFIKPILELLAVVGFWFYFLCFW